jgi:hypothetical protein
VILLSRNPVGWTGSILAMGYKAGGYFTAKYLIATIGHTLAGPVGGLLGAASGYSLQYIIRYATCSRLASDNRDEL